MVVTKYTIIEETFTGDEPAYGFIKFTSINQQYPTYNYGGSSQISIIYKRSTTTTYRAFGVLKLKMPNKNDSNIDEITSVRLQCAVGVDFTRDDEPIHYPEDDWYINIGICEIPDDFDEGEENHDAGYCNWVYRILDIPWSRGDGAVKSRENSNMNSEDGTIFDVVAFFANVGYTTLTFDLSDYIDLNDTKKYGIFVTASSIPAGVIDADHYNVGTIGIDQTDCSIIISGKDYSVEAFEDKDSALSIEPNPDNPEQPLLKWGGVKDDDFVDFKVYRETSAITSVAALTEIATITSPADQEYIDTDALTDGQEYFYLVIAEDGNNTLDDATFSNLIEWTKPDVLTRVLSTTGAIDAGDSVSVTVTSSANVKRLYVDWQDGCTSWYEYETIIPAGSDIVASHVYSMYSAANINPDVRVQDDKGYWSDLYATTNDITVDDVFPTAKLQVSVKKSQLGDYVTLNASLSQPVASNITITKYEFKRDAADSYQDNGTNPIYTFKTGTGGSEYPQSIGVKTATVQITTSAAAFNTDTDTATYELETGTPTELDLSEDTKIHEWNHDLSLNKQVDVPIGSDQTAHEFLISRPPERMTLVGTSNHPNTGHDIALIRAAWLANTYVRFTITKEVEDKTVTYDCKIDGDISLGQAYEYKQSWTFPIRVLVRTVYLGSIIGVSQGSKTFTLDGDVRSLINETINVVDSTGNDGTYTVVSTALTNYDTVITVSEAIPSAVVDGEIEVVG